MTVKTKVTLHVSVWVEMYGLQCQSKGYKVTLHVSVWVEIERCMCYVWAFKSRSTWACELKLYTIFSFLILNGHAPRERVSWNMEKRENIENINSHAPRERVSWNILPTAQKFHGRVTLHVSVWVEIIDLGECTFFTKSRSTWACELKYHIVGIYAVPY